MESVIRQAIQDVLSKLGVTDVDFVVEHPSELSHGDYACNAALSAAKQAQQNPRELAESIVKELEGQIEYVERMEVAGPGFINFFLSRDFFVQEVMRINDAPDTWGTNDVLVGTQVLIEYTSPNLFKPLHVGNLVGNIVGEALSRLYQFSGADVKRLNYPSDIGLTVAKGVWGLQKTGGDPKDVAALGDAYREGNASYESDESAKQEIEAINRALYAGDNEGLNALRAQGIATSQAHIDMLCAKLGTQFDTVIYESQAAPVGKQLVEEHTGDIFESSDGAVVYKGEKHGLHTRVFLNSQGLPTYEAKDLGNFALKQEAHPQWQQSIVVTGSEQTEYFKVVNHAIQEVFALSPEKQLRHVPTGFLTLSTGKMSSRAGNVLTGEDILTQMEARALARAKESRADDVESLGEMVAVAALKYQILRHGLGTDIVFDKEKALSFEGDSGPYLQYTYARLCSVLEKAHNAGITARADAAPAEPYSLEHILYRFEEVISVAIETGEINGIATYLIELAGACNAFYAREQIADANDPHAPYKVVLCSAVAHTLKNGLWVLGIVAPEKM